jgi:hypothetical protein
VFEVTVGIEDGHAGGTSLAPGEVDSDEVHREPGVSA